VIAVVMMGNDQPDFKVTVTLNSNERRVARVVLWCHIENSELTLKAAKMNPALRFESLPLCFRLEVVLIVLHVRLKRLQAVVAFCAIMYNRDSRRLTMRGGCACRITRSGTLVTDSGENIRHFVLRTNALVIAHRICCQRTIITIP
jgi:hypothetical protein